MGVNMFYRCDRCHAIVRESDTFIVNENSKIDDVAYYSDIFCLKCFKKELLRNKVEVIK